MELKTNNNYGIFMIDGSINASSTESFHKYMDSIIEKYKKTINIDRINKIQIRLELRGQLKLDNSQEKDKLNLVNISNLSNQSEISGINFSASDLTSYSIYDDIINIDDHQII